MNETEESFRRSWAQAMRGETRPIAELWANLDSEDKMAYARNDYTEDERLMIDENTKPLHVEIERLHGVIDEMDCTNRGYWDGFTCAESSDTMTVWCPVCVAKKKANGATE